MKIKRLISIFLFLFLFFMLKAEKQSDLYINVDSLTQSYNLNNKLSFFEDKTSSLIIDTVISNNFQNNFKICKKSDLNFGYSSSSLWLKFKIKNTSNLTQNLILEIANQKIQSVALYEIDNSLKINKTTTDYLFSKKKEKETTPVFSLHLKQNNTYTYYINIKNNLSTQVSISLRTHNQLIKEKSKKIFINGIFYGVLFCLFIFALIFYFLFKDFSFLAFSFYTITAILFLLNFDGFLFEYSWQSSYLWYNYSTIFLQGAVIISIALFSKSVLSSRAKVINVNFSFYFILIITVIILLLSIYHPFLIFSSKIIYIWLIIAPIICLTNYFKVLNKNNEYFLYYIITFSLFVVFVFIAALHNFGLIGNSYFSINALKIAFITHILLTFLISINKYLNLNLLPFYNNIKKNIYEELQIQNEELQAQNEELESQKEELNTQQELIKANNAELEKLKLAVSKTNNLIYIFDTEGDLLWCNASFSSLLKEVIGYPNEYDKINICNISYNKNIKENLKYCVENNKSITYETEFVQNGVELSYQTTLTPIVDGEGNLSSLIAIDTDITKLKEYERKIQYQKQDLELQKNAVELKNAEIIDSINYAQRIQSAILPKTIKLFEIFDGFVFFKPKDIVSGDFYWYQHINGKYVIIGVDCTGHGVPGAFMSIIGNYLLNDIVIHNQVTDPAKILKLLNRKIKIALKVEDPTVYTNDGMDVSVCAVDKENGILQYAGALRPLYFVHGNEFIEVKGDKISISSNITNYTIQSFTVHTFKLEKGDAFYIFSDGIIDQFGGEHNKKFLSKRLRQIIKDVYFMDMKEQKQIIIDNFNDWKGDNEQVDDVLLIGIKY